MQRWPEIPHPGCCTGERVLETHGVQQIAKFSSAMYLGGGIKGSGNRVKEPPPMGPGGGGELRGGENAYCEPMKGVESPNRVLTSGEIR
jgi:hypothetical protein